MRYRIHGSWLPIAASVLLSTGQVLAADAIKPLGPDSNYQKLTAAEQASLVKRRMEHCQRHPERCRQVAKPREKRPAHNTPGAPSS